VAAHVWPDIVQEYLTTHRSFLVSREYNIADDWAMYPDLLALDFRARRVWFVEVTSGSSTAKIQTKARQFETEIIPRLKKRLVEFGIIPTADSDWSFGLWAFVRRDCVKGLQERVGALCEVTALEDIAFSWSYWDKRRADEVVA
jgi:hypothetical protein